MGQFRVEVTAVGGHGCQREVKDGENVRPCDNPACPDCMARKLVHDLAAHGCTVESAILTHWPGQAGEVRDDLVTGKRSGSF